jgi:hypothetical protein
MLSGFPTPRYALAAGRRVLEWPCRVGPGGLTLVKARVNRAPDLEFIVDTGAPVTVVLNGPRTAALQLDTSHARRLGPDDDPAVPMGTIQAGFELGFEGLTISGLTAVVIAQSSLACQERFAAIDFQGVIGADLLRRFVVQMDTAASVLRLFEPGSWVPGATDTALALDFVSGHPFAKADVHLGGRIVPDLRLHVDTGQSHALSLLLGARPELQEGLAREPRQVCYVSGMRQVWSGEPLQLSLGGQRIEGVVPSYQRRQDAPRVGQREGSLGIGLLSRFGPIIDYPGSRLWLRARA